MRIILFILFVIPITLMSQSNKLIAYQSIQDLKKSVVLVRLHTDEVIIQTMKNRRQFNMLKEKVEEVTKRNKETYRAFSSGYSFTEVYFFYAKSSDDVRMGSFENILVGSDLLIDTTLHLPEDKGVYIIDVGDIYFDAFGGHFEGMMVMDKNFTPLKKPFPYYVKKRIGLGLRVRSDLDMVLILQENLEELLDTSNQFDRQKE